MAGRISDLCGAGQRCDRGRRRRDRIRRFVPWRHRSNVRTLSGRDGGRRARTDPARHHDDASNGRQRVGGQGIATSIRLALVADCDERNRRESIRIASGACGHGGALQPRVFEALLGRTYRALLTSVCCATDRPLTISALASPLEASVSARTATLSPDGGEGIERIPSPS